MILFIIPAYNEEENIKAVLTSIKETVGPYNYKVIVVNDGSTDKTKEVISSLNNDIPLVVLNHEVNKGVGEVFKTGFRYAEETAKKGDIIVTKEADNTSDPLILKEMLDRIHTGDDLVLASCYANGGAVVGTTFVRELLSFTANIILRILYPIKNVRTYSSFYRAYAAELLQRAYKTYDDKFIEQRGFVCMVEVLAKLNRLKNVKITEVPMVLQCNKRIGKSKMRVAQNILDYFKFFIKDKLGILF